MRGAEADLNSSHLELLNTICLYWTAASVLIIIITLLVMAPERHSGKYAFSHVSRGLGMQLGGEDFMSVAAIARLHRHVGICPTLISCIVFPLAPLTACPAHTQFDASYSGWPSAWAFFVGLLQAAYTLTGYGMVAALCEEVRDPVREVPRAMGE